jgi:SAM-dependent methyltransferase
LNVHKTGMLHGRLFFETYVRPPARVVDIGAQDVNGSLRSVAPAGCPYVGVDFVEGRGVDVVVDDAYKLPFADGSFDVAVTSSCFEHSEFFWLTFLEVLRILKPSGLLYLNAPSNGPFHRYPVDCWRFYPDCGAALQNWARHNGMQTLLLESFTGPQKTGAWNDFVAVFVKDAEEAERYPRRIIDRYPEVTNGLVAGQEQFINERFWPADQATMSRRLARRVKALFGKHPD